MTTDNPKISFYVPQAIYERFVKFKDERELSMSQAGIVILSEYFGRQMANVRCVATGGVLKEYLKALENEPEDLIGEGDEDLPDEGHLYFGWRQKEKKYRLVDY